ncbi:MAG: hypothetical protein HRJ53_11975, partial [Acidobacteria bacterium Pan2503]|nr:hypothetical protein [Candidatus Acidoferrum panamensis]
MDLPEMLTWEELQRRLTKIMICSPQPYDLGSSRGRDPCIQRVIRLRDIANYTGIYRAEIYRVRRGERSLTKDVQQRLSWFFFNLDRGRLVKEPQPDGKWRIVFKAQEVHPHAADARAPAIEATVD